MEHFMETYDSSMALAQSGFVRQRLESGVRDDKGRFRIAAGTSSLHKEDTTRKGLTIAELQAQVDAERKAKEDARRAKKRKADSAGASTAPKERKEKEASGGAVEWQSKWVVPGIIVKIMSKEQPDLYKAKVAVLKVTRDGDKGDVTATVELEGGKEHEVHSRDLETVIPAVGGTVRVVSGRYRGETGDLLALETELFQGRIMLKGGSSDGKEVMLDYELFSKVNKQRAGGTGA